MQNVRNIISKLVTTTVFLSNSFCVACYGSEGVTLSTDTSRTLYIRGVIGSANLLDLGAKLEAMATKSSLPVDLIIDSPGGEVLTGRLFINYMFAAQALGTKIRCFVPHMAASMAFSILTHCDQRYVLSNAVLLWHRAATMLGGGFMSSGTRLDGMQAAAIARDLLTIDEIIVDELTSTLHLPEEEIMYHLNQQTLHFGSVLSHADPKFITSQDYIEGLLDLTRDYKKLQIPTSESAKQFTSSVVYVYTGSVGK